MFNPKILPRLLEYFPIRNRILNVTAFYTIDNKQVIIRDAFENIENKNKSTYLELIQLFIERDVKRRGHVEFINSALKNMQNFDVHKDLETYKALLDVLPKGKFIPTNIFQAEFMHYPKQQECAINLLQQMEDNGVMPDYEMQDILLNIFGRRGYPLRKYWRMMYWMPKFKNLSPWPVPRNGLDDIFELAKEAIKRISSADIQSQLSVFHTASLEDAVEDTWIVSAQSPNQRLLLQQYNVKEPLTVAGPFKVWLRNKCIDYFVLKSNTNIVVPLVNDNIDDVSNLQFPVFNTLKSKPVSTEKHTVHEQEDGIIFALCATGTSSLNSLLCWMKHLIINNNNLSSIPVVFSLRTVGKAHKGEIVTNNKM